ncbi:MAG: DUF2283 domain-containing protein [Methanobacteriaceae archaeon]|jgi:uncharacterized protein YuzE|nr:DUF2283 domain-containing protein [Candidatus Methanorudis spinitermitis]
MSGMKICKAYYEYNDEIDALFIHNKKDYIYDSSIELDHDIILDYDHDGIPVAIELLNTSKIFKVPKNSLKSIDNVHVYVKITEKSIFLELNFEVCLNNKKQNCFFDSLKSNNVSLPTIEVKIA